jgi:predicted nucleic acid-binding protein
MSHGFQGFNAVITDASCFILLDKIDSLSILNALFTQVVTTPEIADEFGKPLPEWVKINTVRDKVLQISFEENVDAGEASAIALAIETPSSLLIIDDLKGRKLALSLNLLHTGTLGVLVLAKKQGVITLLRPLLKKIQSTNFRLSQMLIDNILHQAGE